ncbi:Putative bacteriophage protein [Streptomyces ambofaciens ATCC 23877]|uniref:Putative bacteriophage protein n=1 Tax=Streptomyces ambofaciens (strain ATCC 23877 / 3486 / DSM 40053 / JCM 4204 / NBRC 12836 / NRRL B-2516) TaxID=278992 RepID=A0A0K2B241_STRA7|nr:hypothetical protein [Streptomyces ambofaciens]AKZ59211.1 Putative bacteriophage protein [Streptomyces ambofaciens ATCC 23877]WNA15404.1 hypothetical protein SAMYPH_73 [Streptomyces phage Samy]
MFEISRIADLHPTAITHSARQLRLVFPNGFGASVITDGYGAEEGLYEVAVLDADGHVTYDTPVTGDVEGYQTSDEVAALLHSIAVLPSSALER